MADTKPLVIASYRLPQITKEGTCPSECPGLLRITQFYHECRFWLKSPTSGKPGPKCPAKDGQVTVDLVLRDT